jgi:hypothetical protein
MSCSIVEGYQLFRGSCCLHLHPEAWSCITMVCYHNTTQHHKPENLDLNLHCHVNFKPHINVYSMLKYLWKIIKCNSDKRNLKKALVLSMLLYATGWWCFMIVSTLEAKFWRYREMYKVSVIISSSGTMKLLNKINGHIIWIMPRRFCLLFQW